MRKKAAAVAKNIAGATKNFLRLVKGHSTKRNKRIKRPEVRNPIYGFNQNPYRPCFTCGAQYPRNLSECPHCAQMLKYRPPADSNSRMSSGAY